MGFLSKQIKENADNPAGLTPEQIEKLKKDSDFKSEIDIAVEKCGKNFYPVIKDMLIRFEFIDVEHIEKAFKTTLKKIEDECIDSSLDK